MRISDFALLLIIVLLAILFSVAGCASGLLSMSDAWCDTHPEAPPAQCVRDHNFSWDQAHLKADDKAQCPGAVYLAPGGNLEQCL